MLDHFEIIVKLQNGPAYLNIHLSFYMLEDKVFGNNTKSSIIIFCIEKSHITITVQLPNRIVNPKVQ